MQCGGHAFKTSFENVWGYRKLSMYLMWEKIWTETVPRPTPADTLADKTI